MDTSELLKVSKAGCYGCSACYNICPKKAIDMVENEKGFLTPVINEELCINCKLCKKVCSENIKLNSVKETYIAKNKDLNVLKKSQSGGAFSGISQVILNKGGVVYGAALNEEFEAIHIRAESFETRNSMRGSKYIQSKMGNVFKMVEKDLSDKTVLFTGTPCQIGGLYKYLKNKKVDFSNLYTMDIICHGVPSIRLWRDLLNYYEIKFNDKIQKINFRDKRFGWGTHFSTIKLEENEVKDEYHRKLFYNNLALRDSCYKCEYSKMKRVSDISIGDAWGVKENDPNFYKNSDGISLVILNSEKGIELFEKAKDEMEVKQVDINNYKQGNLQNPTKPNRDIKEFWQDYNQKGFNFIIKKYAKNNLLLNMKYILKKIIKKFA